MFLTKKALPRRTFLRGVGAVIGLPLLDAMVPAAMALAATPANTPRRFGFMYVPHGADMASWTPTTAGTGFALSPTLDVLERHKQSMVVVNKAAFNALDKAARDAVTAEAKKAESAGWAASRAVAEATKKELAAKGIKVMAPSKQLTDDLAKIGKILLDEWLKGAGPDGAALVAAFQK